MTRSASREAAFMLLFEASFSNTPDVEELLLLAKEYSDFHYDEYSERLFREVVLQQESLDEKINKYSSGWKTTRLPKVSLCVLRRAIYEIDNVDDVPAASAINEAVELTKKFDGENSAKFVNGILGTYVRENGK